MTTIVNGVTITDPVSLVQFDTTVGTPPHQEGLVYWDSDAKTISIMTDIGEVVLQVGQEFHARAINNSGAEIGNGCVVYITGANGSGLPTIAEAMSDDAATSSVLGMATEAIANGATGIVSIHGLVRDIDTSSFSAGDAVYLSSTTPGAVVNTIPNSPNFTVVIGTVLTSNADTGVILVDITQAAIVSGTLQSKIYSLPLRGALDSSFNITGELRDVATGETGDYATAFPVSNNHVYLYVNTITGTGDVTIAGTSLSESSAVPVESDTEVLTLDTSTSQYWQTTKKWLEVTSIDIPPGISAIDYDIGVVGYSDFGNTDYKIVGYRIDSMAQGTSAELRFRLIKVEDDGNGKMSVTDLEDIRVDVTLTDQITDYLRTGGDDRTYEPGVASIWLNNTTFVFKQGDFDTYFTSDENHFESSTKDEGFILRIEGANHADFLTLRLDYQLLG